MSQKVLIVDDETRITDGVARRLGPALKVLDGEVVAFNNPYMLLEWISLHGMPKAVVTDDEMPEMLGRDLAKQLRLIGYKGMIVMVSGTANESVYDFGVNVLLEKPISVDAILSALLPAFS